MILQYEPLIKEEYAMAVSNQINSGWIGPGKTVKTFEEKFAAYVKSEYALATTSGSSAIMVALLALGLKPNDSVVVSNYSFIAAINVIRLMNLNPILVDINRDTLCMDIDETTKLLDEKNIKACIFINHNGYIGNDVVNLKKACQKRNIPLIEDAACALGQWYDNKHAGTIGDVGTFSFSVPKLITTGQGGMIVTDDYSIHQRCEEIIDQGSITWRQDGFHAHTGANFKFNDILAAYGLAQLNTINDLLERRLHLYNRYLSNGIKLHFSNNTDLHPDNLSPWMMVLIAENAHDIHDHLEKHDIQTRFYYKPARYSIGDPKICPVTEKLYHQILYIPSSLTLTDKQIDFVSEKIKEITTE